ncbi:NAD(P)-dependent oxidoreductase [Psychromonas sp.]|uniref:NAD(P)-dependent oxidoreductase n=1 Tax=Psychromonas sp. TaxID=1884585 RepID=UPI00356554B3
MKYKILASEKFEIPEPLQETVTIDVFDDLWRDETVLATTAKGYDALIVRNMTQVNSNLLEQLKSIKVIGRLGAGTENIDVDYANQCHIPIVYAPLQNTNAVAEFCVAQVFNAFRHLPDAIHEAKQGVWNREKYLSTGREISGCNVGVIGFGNIGKAFTQKMDALGANVLIYNRTPSNVTAAFHHTDLVNLLKSSDIISIHLPGGDKTKNFLHEGNIGLIKRGAFLMNSSRGGVVNETALLAALESGQLSGAMIDVRTVEPAYADALARHPNVYPTPHIAAFTLESQTAISESVVMDIIRVLQNKSPQYPVPVR